MGDLDQRRVITGDGEGLVVRVRGVVAVIGPGEATGTRLAVEASRAASVEGPDPATALGRRLRALLAAGTVRLPAVAALAEGDDGHSHLLVVGAATAVATTEADEEIALGASNGALHTASVPGPLAQAWISLDRAAGPPDPQVDLAGGVVPGATASVLPATTTSGFRIAEPTEDRPAPPLSPPSSPVVHPDRRTGPGASRAPTGGTGDSIIPSSTAGDPITSSTTPDDPTVVAASARSTTRSTTTSTDGPATTTATSGGGAVVSIRLSGAGGPDHPVAWRAPLPIAGSEVAAGDTVEVDLVRCPAGHPNDPAASSCRVCDQPLAPDRPVEHGPRPPLGLLVFDDGATFVLDGDYVVGRAPAEDAPVRSGRARPLAVDDAHRTVSRVHADIRIDGWEVRLDDRGSTNGTYLWDTAARTWVRLVPSEARRLLPGDRAAVGHRTFRLETHLGDTG